MYYAYDLTMTEEDYLAFNQFHSLRSPAGKKAIRTGRTVFLGAILLLMVLVVILLGLTVFSAAYIALMALFSALYMIFYKKLILRSVKGQMKRLKKTGKLPYEPVARIEFYEDRLVEITPAKRTEMRYDVIERICQDTDRYLYLYNSSVGAHILPLSQIRDPRQLLEFLISRCPGAEIILS